MAKSTEGHEGIKQGGASPRQEKKGNENMKTYYIYNADVDYTEYIGEVKANSITEAEIKAGKELKTECNVYALTTAPNEPWA